MAAERHDIGSVTDSVRGVSAASDRPNFQDPMSLQSLDQSTQSLLPALPDLSAKSPEKKAPGQQESRVSFQQEPSKSFENKGQPETPEDDFTQAGSRSNPNMPVLVPQTQASNPNVDFVDPLEQVPEQIRGIAFFCKQFIKRIWQLLLYGAFVIPPSICTGLVCSFLLYAIKLVTSLRNGTCDMNNGETGYQAMLGGSFDENAEWVADTSLVACEHIVGANRWLLYCLSFSGLFVAALYVYLGNSNAAGGMNTILKGIQALDKEIDRLVADHHLRDSDQPPPQSFHSPEFAGMVSLRMCPLVWIGTVTTHLTGGAAGREGSALQMAAAIFSKYCDFLDATLGKCNPNFILTIQLRRAALIAAIASGFSGIFGVPVTGAIFAVEVLRVGELTFGEMLQPALIGAFFADWTCRLSNQYIFSFEGHSEYTCDECQAHGDPQAWLEPSVDAGLELLAVIPAAFAFGLCGYAFEWLLHHFKHIFGDIAGKLSRGNANAKSLLTPFIGGWVIVLMWLVLCAFGSTNDVNFARNYNGTDQKSSTFGQAYLGLSVYEPGASISSCFYNFRQTVPALDPKSYPDGPGCPSKEHPLGVCNDHVQPIMWYSFLLKLLFTTVTLGAGFKGGEVTPIFFIGAALGNVCGQLLRQDTQLFSALGLVSVFAAASNTPIACTFMAVELFGGAKVLPYLMANYIAYLVSNTEKVNGIYAAQEDPRGGSVLVTPFSRRAPHQV